MSLQLNRVLKAGIATMVIVTAAGCKMNLTADVYTADLRDAVTGTEGLMAPATLALQVPDTNECAKHTAEIADIMEGVVADFSPKGCESVEIESFLMAEIRMPIVTSASAWSASDSLFGILVREQEDGIEASVAMNLEKYRLLTVRLQEKFFQTIDLATSTVVLSVNHDEREPVEVVAEGVFVNSEPVPDPTDFRLERRQRLEIRLSNVSTAYLAKQGVASGFVLTTQP